METKPTVEGGKVGGSVTYNTPKISDKSFIGGTLLGWGRQRWSKHPPADPISQIVRDLWCSAAKQGDSTLMVSNTNGVPKTIWLMALKFKLLSASIVSVKNRGKEPNPVMQIRDFDPKDRADDLKIGGVIE